MRLVALFLTGALAAQAPTVGQGPRALPWQTGSAPPWQPLGAIPAGTVVQDEDAPMQASSGPLRARISEDGTLEVLDAGGVRSLRIGLPGRPVKVWRDGGILVPRPWTALAFPKTDPLSGGLGALAWNSGDFRPSLSGLLWILEDGERVLTIVHPATAQVVHVPLPRGESADLDFEPSRLIARLSPGDDEAQARAWALPWLALLPQMARLGPSPAPAVRGTALKPFPTTQGLK